MKKFKIYLIFGLIVSLIYSFKGTLYKKGVKLVEGSRQEWSGGVAGRAGSKFHFIISSTYNAQVFVPDSVRIGNTSYKVVIKSEGISQAASNCQVSEANGLNLYTFRFNHDRSVYRFKESPSEDQKTMPMEKKDSPVVLIYILKGKRKQMELKGFVTKPPIYYP